MSRFENNEIFDFLPSILLQTDGDGMVVVWNDAADERLGISNKMDEGTSFKIWDLPLNWDKEKLQEALQTCCNTLSSVPIDDLKYVTPFGKEAYLGLTLFALGGSDTGVDSILWYGADITQRKQMQSQLMQAQKLSSIGQLANGLAHEINTPAQYTLDNLAFIQESMEDQIQLIEKYAQFVEKQRGTGDSQNAIAEIDEYREDIDIEFLEAELPKAAQRCIEGVNQVAKIVQAMKEFSSSETEEKQHCDVNRIIENAITVTKSLWSDVAEMCTELDPSANSVPCMKSQLGEVLFGMISNGVDAIKETGDTGGAEHQIKIGTSVAANAVTLTISDTGIGMTEEVQRRMFDPFFTTKEVGQGTGQGLSTAYATIVDNHGGTIHCASKPGEGTQFTITLPL